MRRSEIQKGQPSITAETLFKDGLEGPSMGSGYGRVQARIFSLDPWSEFEEMERFLEGIGRAASQLSYGELANELEQIENHAWKAAKLLAHAQDARDLFELDAKVVDAALKQKAHEAIEELKREGKFTKTIAIADVDAYAAAHFTAEYKDLAARRSKAKRMVEAIERGCDLLKHRRNTLDTLTKGVR